jgi:hypothetical protein
MFHTHNCREPHTYAHTPCLAQAALALTIVVSCVSVDATKVEVIHPGVLSPSDDFGLAVDGVGDVNRDGDVRALARAVVCVWALRGMYWLWRQEQYCCACFGEGWRVFMLPSDLTSLGVSVPVSLFCLCTCMYVPAHIALCVSVRPDWPPRWMLRPPAPHLKVAQCSCCFWTRPFVC